MTKRILLNIPVLLGLLMIDSLGLNFLRGYIQNGSRLTAGEITIVVIVVFLSVMYFLYWGKAQGFAEWSFKNVCKNRGKIIIGFLIILLVSGSYNMILSAFNLSVVSANQQGINSLEKLVPPLLMCLFTDIAGPVMEETIFRLAIFKLIFPDRDKLALIVSTLVFAFFHMTTELTNFLAWPPYLIMGFVFGYLYYKTKKIEVDVSAHFLWNLFADVIHLLLRG